VGARANDRLATARGNPARNPLHRFGDTPTGTWRVREILPSGPETNFPAAEFGPYGVVVLEAAGGDAALADANGRFRILIQAGDPSPEGRLRATAGALRLSNDAQCRLVEAIENRGGSRCDVVVNDAVASNETVAFDGVCDLEDPPLSPTSDTPNGIALDVTRRDALRVGAGGAVALNLAVSFVALTATSSPARSEYVEVAYNSPSQNHTEVGPGDERTTGGEPSPIQGGGQPITGAGVTQGTPDRPPPPNPAPPPQEIQGGQAAGQANKAATESESGAKASTDEGAAAKAGAPFDRSNPVSTVTVSPPSDAKANYFKAMSDAGKISDPNARNAAINQANSDYAKATGQPAPAMLPTNQPPAKGN
jgi:hypothetical protein